MDKTRTAEIAADKSNRQTGKRLPLDVGMHMSISLGNLGEDRDKRIAVELVGLVHFEYLILRLPWIPGLRARLIPEAGVTVRFISDGVLCAFQSVIITHVGKPSLLLFLQYPETMEKLSLRRHKRVRCALPARVHGHRGDAKGVVVNLSQSGCRLLLDASKKTEFIRSVAGDELALQFALDAESRVNTVTCVIRNVKTDNNRILLGLSFVGIEPDFAETLRFFLEQADLLGGE